MIDGYSYTSNTVKLLKHLDKLKNIQDGNITPIMVHTIPTHRCQLKCAHCCFKNRKDKKAEMPLEQWKEAMSQIRNLGTKALEFTGGGDPTLWTHINEGIEFASVLGYHMGLITNGLAPKKIDNWSKIDWVRVSLNSLDYDKKIDLKPLRDTHISFCYIWNLLSDKKIKEVIDFANKHEIVCRLAPDCITTLDNIQKQLDYMREMLKGFPDNKYVFLSDFNIDLYRRNNSCRIHMIKPCLYLDGYLYACPSAELAMENDKQIKPTTRICKFDNIYSYYRTKGTEVKYFNCSYCKYVKQQELLEDILMETDWNEFA
jgi:MoaA/NifB/PqqE/SkfB family radical SAM enzyme